jgi:hypothetical protein
MRGVFLKGRERAAPGLRARRDRLNADERRAKQPGAIFYARARIRKPRRARRGAFGRFFAL